MEEQAPETAQEWMDKMLAWKSEPLIPELLGYVEKLPGFGTVLRSPLVYQVPLFTPGQANETYRLKKKAVKEAEARNDMGSVVFLHERAYRLDALVRYVVGADELTEQPCSLVGLDQEARDLAADVWIDSENIDQYLDVWGALFRGWEPDMPLLLGDRDEQAEFNAMPDVLRVYRAGIDDGGWSWTLDPKIAVFFAKRFGSDHPMETAIVKKSDVFGYLSRRTESEVLVADGAALFDKRPYVHVEDVER